MKVEIIPKTLHFKQPAGTSRGVYTTRKVWYIVMTDTQNPNHFGVGEGAPLPALSCDDVPQYEEVLQETCRRLEENMKANPENAFVFRNIVATQGWERGTFAHPEVIRVLCIG